MNEQNVTAGFNAPASLVQAKISEGKAKTEMPVWKVLLLGIFAGMFIAFGASSSSLAIHAIENPGVAKLIAGLDCGIADFAGRRRAFYRRLHDADGQSA